MLIQEKNLRFCALRGQRPKCLVRLITVKVKWSALITLHNGFGTQINADFADSKRKNLRFQRESAS
jgi:hypothetical protein